MAELVAHLLESGQTEAVVHAERFMEVIEAAGAFLELAEKLVDDEGKDFDPVNTTIGMTFAVGSLLIMAKESSPTLHEKLKDVVMTIIEHEPDLEELQAKKKEMGL